MIFSKSGISSVINNSESVYEIAKLDSLLVMQNGFLFQVISNTYNILSSINREIITKSDIEAVEAGVLLSLKKLQQDRDLLLKHLVQWLPV